MIKRKPSNFTELLSYYKLKRNNFQYLSKDEIIELHDIAAIIKTKYDSSDTIEKINIFNIIGDEILTEIEDMVKQKIIIKEANSYKRCIDNTYVHYILGIPISTLN